MILTNWDRETHICVGEHASIGLDNGLSPNWRQAIIWSNAGILLVEPLGTNFNEILIEILTFSFKEMHLKMSSGKWRPFCLRPSVLTGLVTPLCPYTGSSLVRTTAWHRTCFNSTGVDFMWIGTLRTKFSEILIQIQHFSIKQLYLKM